MTTREKYIQKLEEVTDYFFYQVGDESSIRIEELKSELFDLRQQLKRECPVNGIITTSGFNQDKC